MFRPMRAPAAPAAPAEAPEVPHDVATLVWEHLCARIERMPTRSQGCAWLKVSRTLAAMPDPSVAELLEEG